MKYLASVIIALILVIIPIGTFALGDMALASSSEYSGIPTFSIVSVEADSTVTIKTNNFPADDSFDVLMGDMGTRGINGESVDTISSGDGGVFTATFDIPASLHGSYQIAIRLQSDTSGYYAYNWFYNNTTGDGSNGGTDDGYTGVPTFSIESVVADKSVTIKTKNFPADDSFDVLMGDMGTRGINGESVDTISSGDGGVFTATFDIPASLDGSYQIAIRLQSDASGYYAYNWFYNNTTGGGSNGGADDGYTGIPTFAIESVVADSSVTIKTDNFPSDDSFDVLMGYMGTRGINGTEVDSISSGSGGVFTQTFSIPASLHGQYQIAIRLQSNSGSGYYAYNWFYNNTTNATSKPTAPASGYTGIPTFSITSVVQDSTVTITTNNFPEKDGYNVLMGYMGTQGVNGTMVDTIWSGNGGVMVKTFNIPSALYGQYKISIRLQSNSGSGYYAYNWFYNNTYP